MRTELFSTVIKLDCNHVAATVAPFMVYYLIRNMCTATLVASAVLSYPFMRHLRLFGQGAIRTNWPFILATYMLTFTVLNNFYIASAMHYLFSNILECMCIETFGYGMTAWIIFTQVAVFAVADRTAVLHDRPFTLFALGAALGIFLMLAWYWPLQAFTVALSMVYTHITVRDGAPGYDPVVDYVVVYTITQLAVVLVYHYPIVLAPVPIIQWVGDRPSATSPVMKLDELISTYESHCDGSGPAPPVPSQYLVDWHLMAAKFYHTVVQQEYYMDLPAQKNTDPSDEVTTDTDTDDNDSDGQHGPLDD